MQKPNSESKTITEVRRHRAEAFREMASMTPEAWAKKERELIERLGLADRVLSPRGPSKKTDGRSHGASAA
jgi:hypothetical protein